VHIGVIDREHTHASHAAYIRERGALIDKAASEILRYHDGRWWQAQTCPSPCGLTKNVHVNLCFFGDVDLTRMHGEWSEVPRKY
jgi:hypothetical protein